MRHLKLTVSYDGTDYHGWALQPAAHGATIQGVMQERFSDLTGEAISLVAASRTDAGVHARGQVVAFATRSRIPVERWPLVANSVLPPDIAVLCSEETWPGFDPRRAATAKTYVYTIHNSYTPDVMARRYCYHFPAPLAVEPMRQAASYLVGTHDFRAFAAAGGAAKTFMRTIYVCRVEQDGPKLRIKVTGNGFLYNMVRIIAGTLLYVGLNKLAPEDLPGILASGRRELAGPTAPPQGLCLERVFF